MSKQEHNRLGGILIAKHLKRSKKLLSSNLNSWPTRTRLFIQKQKLNSTPNGINYLVIIVAKRASIII
jgi:hypothetical protein